MTAVWFLFLYVLAVTWLFTPEPEVIAKVAPTYKPESYKSCALGMAAEELFETTINPEDLQSNPKYKTRRDRLRAQCWQHGVKTKVKGERGWRHRPVSEMEADLLAMGVKPTS